MACNCGRNKTSTTSANVVSTTAGVPTEGARTLAARRLAERVEAARNSINSGESTTASSNTTS